MRAQCASEACGSLSRTRADAVQRVGGGSLFSVPERGHVRRLLHRSSPGHSLLFFLSFRFLVEQGPPLHRGCPGSSLPPNPHMNVSARRAGFTHASTQKSMAALRNQNCMKALAKSLRSLPQFEQCFSSSCARVQPRGRKRGADELPPLEVLKTHQALRSVSGTILKRITRGGTGHPRNEQAGYTVLNLRNKNAIPSVSRPLIEMIADLGSRAATKNRTAGTTDPYAALLATVRGGTMC